MAGFVPTNFLITLLRILSVLVLVDAFRLHIAMQNCQTLCIVIYYLSDGGRTCSFNRNERISVQPRIFQDFHPVTIHVSRASSGRAFMDNSRNLEDRLVLPHYAPITTEQNYAEYWIILQLMGDADNPLLRHLMPEFLGGRIHFDRQRRLETVSTRPQITIPVQEEGSAQRPTTLQSNHRLHITEQPSANLSCEGVHEDDDDTDDEP